MRVSKPFVKPTKPRDPAMLLYLNARRNHLRVPLSLDLSSEIDRITSRQAKRERFSLGCRGWGGRRYTGARVARRWRRQASFGKYEQRGYGVHFPNDWAITFDTLKT